MEPYRSQSTAIIGNKADGNSINFYGSVDGDVHLPSTSSKLDHNQCIRDLRVSDPREDRARILYEKDRLLKDCYSWVLEDASFLRWRAQSDSRILWIKGDPGKGKTMMLMGLIDELSHRTEFGITPAQASKVVYFFCQNTSPELNNAVSVLRGLIYLLVVQNEHLIRHVQTRYETIGSRLFDGPNALYALGDILFNILNDTSLPMTYLFVDALDECTSGLPALLQLMTNNRLTHGARFRWILSSRNLPIIERFLRSDSLGIKISLELNASAVSKAVTAFIRFKVDYLATLQQYSSYTRLLVEKQLHNKAEGTFLWISLVCKELESVPHYRTAAVLQELPPRLGPLYDYMMAQIASQDKQTASFCNKILQSVTLACRPLKLRELVVVAGLPQDLFDDTQKIDDIVSHCASFLTIRQDTIYFVHLSAKDYFTEDKGWKAFGSTMNKEQTLITHRLLDSMQVHLKRDICNLRKPGTFLQQAQDQVTKSSLPTIAYACEYWVDHLDACARHYEDILYDGGKIDCFLRKHLLHWFEAMSLLQKFPETISAIRKLQSIINEPQSNMLSKLVHDAFRFAMWSKSGVQVAPLQIYCSALLFAPEKSVVRKQFWYEAPAWAQLTSQQDEDWGQLLQTLEGHSSFVTCVAFSPMEDLLVSTSFDKTVRIWDSITGQMLRTLEGHTDIVTMAAFASAGDFIATVSVDMTLRIWNPNTGQQLWVAEGHTDEINAVAISPVDDIIASAANDGTVRLWSSGAGKLLQKLEEHTDRVISIAFSPVGRQLASASSDRTIRLWDPQKGEDLRVLVGHTGPVLSVSYSPGGDRLISTSQDDLIRLWNSSNGQQLHSLPRHQNHVLSACFSPKDGTIAVASGGTIRLWNATTGQALQGIAKNQGLVKSLAISKSGDKMASSSTDTTVRLWDLNVGAQLKTLDGHRGALTSLDFSPAGNRLVSAARDNTSRIWDVENGQTVSVLENIVGYALKTMSPSGDVLAKVVNGLMVKTVELSTGNSLRNFWPAQTRVKSIAFSSQGHLIASALESMSIEVWDANTGELLHILQGDTNESNGIAFSPDDNQLTSASKDGKVRVWDIKSRKVVRCLHGTTDWVPESVRFSPSGDHLVAASFRRRAMIWDLKTGLSTRKPDCYEMIMNTNEIVFSDDGTYLETDLGWVPLQPDLPVTPLQKRSPWSLHFVENWLAVHSSEIRWPSEYAERLLLLWLPGEFRPNPPSMTTTRDSLFAIGCPSSRIVILKVDYNHPDLN